MKVQNKVWIGLVINKKDVQTFLFLEEYLNCMATGEIPAENVVFRKSRVIVPHTKDSLLQCTLPLQKVTCSLKAAVDSFPQCSYVVFSDPVPFRAYFNKVYSQEQIMCIIHPETCLGAFLGIHLGALETLSISGCVRVGRSRGFRATFQYVGPFGKLGWTAVVSNRTQCDQLLFMDAMNCNEDLQFATDGMLREINKAFCAFSTVPTDKDIASGRWGCGAFGGDPYLKSLLQWISASLAGKPVGSLEGGEG